MAEAYIRAGCDQMGLQKKWINEIKGYGVISTTDIMKGGFILEYHGHHLEWKHMQQKMETYSVYEHIYLNMKLIIKNTA